MTKNGVCVRVQPNSYLPTVGDLFGLVVYKLCLLAVVLGHAYLVPFIGLRLRLVQPSVNWSVVSS